MARRCQGERRGAASQGELEEHESREMIAETGHYALILALGVAIVQMVLPLVGARIRDQQLMAVAGPAAQLQFLLIAIAFIALMTAHITSDFSVENVWRTSAVAKPLLYKISGVWGNHEGSMVLWVLILALFGAAVAIFGTNLPYQLKANVLAVQASIAAACNGSGLCGDRSSMRIGRSFGTEPGSRPKVPIAARRSFPSASLSAAFSRAPASWV